MGVEPFVLTLLAAVAVCFAAGLLNRPARSPPKPHELRRAACFTGALIVIYVALLSPLDDASDTLVSVHMTQHLLLVMIAAPLLLQSRFPVVLLRALPRSGRRTAARAIKRLGVVPLWRAASSPVFAWCVFVAVFDFWHAPGPYRAAIDHRFLHEFEHVSLILSALAFWPVALGENPARSRGAAILFVATAAVATGLPGALIFLAPEPLYADDSVKVVGGTTFVMYDQQLAGLIMWLLGGLIYVAVVGRLCLDWIDPPEEVSPATRQQRKG